MNYAVYAAALMESIVIKLIEKKIFSNEDAASIFQDCINALAYSDDPAVVKAVDRFEDLEKWQSAGGQSTRPPLPRGPQ